MKKQTLTLIAVAAIASTAAASDKIIIDGSTTVGLIMPPTLPRMLSTWSKLKLSPSPVAEGRITR